jgi:hypothetical protein
MGAIGMDDPSLHRMGVSRIAHAIGTEPHDDMVGYVSGYDHMPEL